MANNPGREFLKDTVRLTTDFSQTDQNRGVPAPAFEKEAVVTAQRIALPKKKECQKYSAVSLLEAMSRRRSKRSFSDAPLVLEELAFLLWATQGVQRSFGDTATFRPVPSAGARHAFETYLVVQNVTSLQEGLYRYLPIEHELVVERIQSDMHKALVEATLGQAFVAAAAVTFVWTVVPYRMEWRYGAASYKVIAIDAGHVCQNLYLACEAIDAGTCAIAAYHQKLLDILLGVDGIDEFALYLAPVGKV